MQERNQEFTVQLVWNENGVPAIPIPSNARLSLSVFSSGSKHSASSQLPPQPSSISIYGNRAGLIAFAEQIFAIAHTDIEGFHQHFDRRCPANFLDSDKDWELIVGRNDSRAIRKALSTD